jgi:ferredoxin-type protein NapG
VSAWPLPPGAVDDFAARCDGCADCVTACPHRAIGVLADGTVAMNPNALPCHLCEDMPCIAACETGALVPTPLEGIFLGLAVVDASKCFAFQGPECGACSVSCPNRAIPLVGGRPVVDMTSCVGCGLCREACPVWDKAISVVW